jgi:hypothetical protein
MRQAQEPLNRDSSTLDVVEFCCHHSLPADVVGRWVWVEFRQKPPAETRELLKSNGFRWVKSRGQWAHCCGVRSKRGKGDPRWKYGEIPVDRYQEEVA